MAGRRRLSLIIDSRLDEIRRAAGRLRRFCQDLPEEAVYRLETAVVEALNNAVLHSYRNEPGHRVQLRLIRTHLELIAEVSDRGLPIEAAAAPEASNDWRDLPEHGRGFEIMQAWVDEVYCFRRGRLNVVQLRKRL